MWHEKSSIYLLFAIFLYLDVFDDDGAIIGNASACVKMATTTAIPNVDPIAIIMMVSVFWSDFLVFFEVDVLSPP